MATNRDFKVKNGLIVSGDVQQDNAQYIKGKTSAGTATRLFGISGSNVLYVGGVDTALQEILFVNNGVERIRIAPSGFVGVGSANPLTTLHVQSGNVNPLIVTRASDVTVNGASGTTIDIGALSGTTPTTAAQLGAVLNNPATSGYLYFNTRSGGALIERVRFGAAGGVIINAPTSGTPLLVNINDNALNTALMIQNSNVGGSAWARLDLQSGANASLVMFQAATGNASLQTIGANTLTLGTTNIGRLTISASGDIAIGGTPVSYGAGYTSLIVNGSTGGIIDSYSNGVRAASLFSTVSEARLDAFGSRPWNFYTGGVQRLQIDVNGNFGIGRIPSALARLDVLGPGQTLIRVRGGTSDGQGAALYVTQPGSDTSMFAAGDSGAIIGGTVGATSMLWTNNTPLTFHLNGAERMRIDSNGNLRVGTTTVLSGAGERFSLNANSTGFAQFVIQNNNSGYGIGIQGQNNMYFYATVGGIVGSIANNGTTTTYNTSSDERLKKNIVSASSAIAKVKALQVRAFDWRADDSHVEHGFIAQELNEVEPLAVTQGETWAIDPSKLVATLTKALQEALTEIETLKARVAALEI